MNKDGAKQHAEESDEHMSCTKDSTPPVRCDACVHKEALYAKMLIRSANLLGKWADLVAQKEREIKRLKVNEILATGGDPGDYYQEFESEEK